MNHAITVGDLLRVGAIGLGALIFAWGLLIFLSGAFANPETGESDEATCKGGLTIMAVGVAIGAAVFL